jgi:hypothetical protein
LIAATTGTKGASTSLPKPSTESYAKSAYCLPHVFLGE